ncbi:DUF389 domain-containing protein [Salinimicrobium terrae]|uniref:DUF389 domain-containing protein n=1 Tax=Salinimicrobium terrae TaxID=470866 RepID=UPI00041021C9|nr:DUF389 domain-containing protein [Salinimicrobium terrae]
MRLVTIQTPKGEGQKVAELAFQKGISTVAISETTLYQKESAPRSADVVDIQSNTPKVKEFVESLMIASFYNPASYSFTVRHPESLFASEPPEEETKPLTRPTTDVYEELWQFCKVTVSLLGRVFLSAFLVAYGMREGFMPLVIAGLLFLPYHHHMLGIGLSAGMKEWKLFRQALIGFAVTTLLIILGGVAMGLLTEPGIEWTAFMESTVLFSFLISMAIGIAAGLGAVDDAGRRELIGLAATAHISVYPIWFGFKFIYGFDADDKPWHLLLVYLMDVGTLILFASITFKLMKMKGAGIKNFIKGFTGSP